MSKLTKSEREAAPHAGPGDSYPIPDEEHGRKAVQMAKHAGPQEAKSIRRKVHARYPDIKISGAMAHGGIVGRNGHIPATQKFSPRGQ